MKNIIFTVFFGFCRPDDVSDRLSALEAKVENLETNVQNLETENSKLKTEIENLGLEVENLKLENHALKNDVEELEKIVRPGKIPASCQEHADRGEDENGLYQIKPSVDIDPFFVTCDFRKCNKIIIQCLVSTAYPNCYNFLGKKVTIKQNVKIRESYFGINNN